MKNKINQGIKIIIFLSLSMALLYLAFRKVDLRTVFQEIKEAEFSWLALSFVFSIFAFLSRARRWVLMIRPLGYRPGLWNTYHALLSGYLVNFALPRVGEVTRCVALGRKEKIPVDKLVGTVIAERAFDFISLLGILFMMLLLKNDLMGAFLRDNVILPLREKIVDVFGFSSMFFVILGIVLLVLVYSLFHFREKLSRYSFFSKISEFTKGILNGLKAFVLIENKIEFILHTLFIWLNYTLMTWVIVFMIPATEHLGFADGIFLLVIGSLGMAAPVQGGIGAFHWIVSRGLAAVYGISLENGLVYATISHESQMILIAVLGTISIFKIFGKGRKKNSDQTNKDTGNGEKQEHISLS